MFGRFIRRSLRRFSIASSLRSGCKQGGLDVAANRVAINDDGVYDMINIASRVERIHYASKTNQTPTETTS